MSALSIVFIIAIVVLVIMLIKYFLTDKNSLSSIQNAQNSATITASSLATNTSGISDSNFAYSVWFYVNDWNYRYGEPKVVFGRMGSLSDVSGGSISGISGLDPCPTVVLGAIENNLTVSLGCYPGVNKLPTKPNPNAVGVVHNCMVSNIPIQKWVNLTLSVYGRTMDLYIDGKLVRTCLLPGIAIVNKNANIYVTPNGGFNGWTSNLQYYPNSLNPQEAWNIYAKGYGGSMMSNMFGSYQVEVSLIQNGTTQSSVTI